MKDPTNTSTTLLIAALHPSTIYTSSQAGLPNYILMVMVIGLYRYYYPTELTVKYTNSTIDTQTLDTTRQSKLTQQLTSNSRK